MISKLLYASFAAFGVAEASKLQVVHPTDLKRQFNSRVDGEMLEGVIHSDLGNFGHFNYGT